MPKKKRGSNLSYKQRGKDRKTSTTAHLHHASSNYNSSSNNNSSTTANLNLAEDPPSSSSSNAAKKIEQVERVFNLKRTIDRKEKTNIKMKEKMVAAVESELSTKVNAAKDVKEAKNEAKRAKVDADAANVRCSKLEHQLAEIQRNLDEKDVNIAFLKVNHPAELKKKDEENNSLCREKLEDRKAVNVYLQSRMDDVETMQREADEKNLSAEQMIIDNGRETSKVIQAAATLESLHKSDKTAISIERRDNDHVTARKDSKILPTSNASSGNSRASMPTISGR